MSVEDKANTQDGVNTPDPSNTEDKGGDGNDSNTLTQDKVNQLIGKTKAETAAKLKEEFDQRLNEALEEERRLSALSEKEMKKELESKRVQELAEREKKTLLRENELDARDALEELGYPKPSRLAKIVVSEDKNAQAENIKAIDEVIKQVAEEMVEKQLSGTTDTDFGGKNTSGDSKPEGVVTEL